MRKVTTQMDSQRRSTGSIHPPRVKRLTGRELASIIAGLRFWQWKGLNRPIDGERHQMIRQIAADAGDPLSEEEIDTLIERINTK